MKQKMFKNILLKKKTTYPREHFRCVRIQEKFEFLKYILIYNIKIQYQVFAQLLFFCLYNLSISLLLSYISFALGFCKSKLFVECDEFA